MDSEDLARYINATGGATKPWLLAQLRIKKLTESRDQLPPEEYEARLADIHRDLMNLGEWWEGIEDEVF